jgi:NACalpha-BTF3-like transcription factor
MGRDLHNGYSRFINKLQDQEFNIWFNTEEVAKLIGCGKGHALVVMRSIPVDRATIKDERGRYYIFSQGDFTPEELAGWVQTYRVKARHKDDWKVEAQEIAKHEGIPQHWTSEYDVLKDHEKRIAELERKLKSGYVEPKEIRRRWFRSFFA